MSSSGNVNIPDPNCAEPHNTRDGFTCEYCGWINMEHVYQTMEALRMQNGKLAGQVRDLEVINHYLFTKVASQIA